MGRIFKVERLKKGEISGGGDGGQYAENKDAEIRVIRNGECLTDSTVSHPVVRTSGKALLLNGCAFSRIKTRSGALWHASVRINAIRQSF
jgi:hypothetical protein